MTDAATKKPLRVSTDGAYPPYLDLSVSQLDDLRKALDGHGVVYWVDEGYLSFNGGPEMAFVNFGREENAAAIQAILDTVR